MAQPITQYTERFLAPIKRFFKKSNTPPRRHVPVARKQPLKEMPKEQPEQVPQEQKESRRPIPVISPERKKHAEALFGELMKNKKIVHSGKIQFLNFSKIREYMGAKWRRVETIIIEMTKEVTSKYLDDPDIFFRYNEDDFIIIFAKASVEEGKLKCQLIASEIQRLLFEKAKEDEVLSELEVNHILVSFDTDSLKESASPLEDMDITFTDRRKEDKEEDQGTHHGAINKNILSIPEEDIPALHRGGVAAGKDSEFLYMPLRNTRRSTEKSLAIFPHQKDEAQKSSASVEKYATLCASHSKASLAQYDMDTLDHMIESIATLSAKMDISCLYCPVHYDTLASDTHSTQYKTRCQKIKEGVKNKLRFMVFNIPHQAPAIILSRTVSQIGIYCRGTAALVPFNPMLDFTCYVNTGFDSIGVCFTDLHDEKEVETVKKINMFSQRTKKFNLKTLAFKPQKCGKLINIALDTNFDFVSAAEEHEMLAKLQEYSH